VFEYRDAFRGVFLGRRHRWFRAAERVLPNDVACGVSLAAVFEETAEDETAHEAADLKRIENAVAFRTAKFDPIAAPAAGLATCDLSAAVDALGGESRVSHGLVPFFWVSGDIRRWLRLAALLVV